MKENNTTSESAIEQESTNACTDRTALRRRLADRLRQVIGNPVIEEKELAAFDIVMSRRDVLKLGRTSLVVAGLVAAGVPPTVWARRDPSLGVHPCEVGLTAEEQASVTRAAQLAVGTELFQDTIYAQPLVSLAAVNTHALIEGARALPRLQSQLTDTDPDEQAYLDRNYRWGPAELIQLEQDANGDWELVHYRHPWEPRTDGVKTDGLVRQVIMTKDDGLVNPTRVITVTGSSTNSVSYKQTNSTQVVGMAYMVFVEDTAAGSGVVGHLALGTGLADLPAPYDIRSKYPVSWVTRTVDQRTVGSFQGYESADKYTSSGFGFPAAYDPVQTDEFIVLYFQDRIKILCVHDADTPGLMTVSVNSLQKPANAPDARVVHIRWNARQNFDGWIELQNVVLATSVKQPDGSVVYSSFDMDRHQGLQLQQSTPVSATILRQIVNWPQAWRTNSYTVHAASTQSGEFELDYTTIRDVRTLYNLTRIIQLTGLTITENLYVKLANFEGRGIVAFIISEVMDCNTDSTPCYSLEGAFPLTTPSSAAIGKILTFSGGISKFDGLRYVASDENGNLFMFRQRRYIGIDSPYAPPIYGNRDETGQPIASLDPLLAGYLPLPHDTSSTSNLHQLQQWSRATSNAGGAAEYLIYNILLYAALAFATDDTSESQAVWLGNSYKAAYAPSRSAHDSEHVVVKQVQNGEDQIFSAFSVFKNPVDKTWRERQIASQMLITGPQQGETGDHYQATVTPVNAYGKPVPMQLAENANLQIEVRADSPCTVTDETNNFYYDIDRYTSFLALPDPGSGQLNLVTKAETFSQVLYVRLVDVSALSNTTDTALLGAAADTVSYPWLSANLALQAQQRMGNGGQVSSLLGDGLPIADTHVYVSGATLAQSDAEDPWDTKGNYQPTSGNLESLASYLNVSGQNLIAATGQLSDGAPDPDPLYALTSVPSDPERNTVTTSFSYDTGKVVTLVSSPSPLRGGPPGSIFSSISHALHDALHWLQHVESDAYADLSSGVSIASAVDGITATVSKEIMKQVNGVEQDLHEVVDTVEEYASVVANLVVTIVEQTFLGKFIELLIRLISLFLHFKDISALSSSMHGFFDGLFAGAGSITGTESITLPSVPIDSAAMASPYLGAGNDIMSSFAQVTTSSIVTQVEKGLVDAVSGNPLSKKILNKVMSQIAQSLSGNTPQLPFRVSLNQSVADDAIQELTGMGDQLKQGVAGILETAMEDLANSAASDLANPRATFENIANQLGQVFEGVATGSLKEMFELMDRIAKDGPILAHDVSSQASYVTIDDKGLGDLCQLAGIGNVASGKVTLSAAEAIFFPVAAIAWVGTYLNEGTSIKSVEELQQGLAGAAGELGAVDTTRWNLVRILVDDLLQEIAGLIWLVKGTDPSSGLTPAEKTFVACGAWFGLARWTNDLSFATYKYVNSTPTVKTGFDWGVVAFRIYTATLDAILTLPDQNLNVGAGWEFGDPKGTDLTQLMNVMVQAAVMGVDTAAAVEDGVSDDAILTLVGQDIFRCQLICLFLENLSSPDLDELLPEWAALIFGTPAIGAQLQAIGLGLSATEDRQVPGHCAGGRGTEKGRKTRTRKRPFGQIPNGPKG